MDNTPAAPTSPPSAHLPSPEEMRARRAAWIADAPARKASRERLRAALVASAIALDGPARDAGDFVVPWRSEVPELVARLGELLDAASANIAPPLPVGDFESITGPTRAASLVFPVLGLLRALAGDRRLDRSAIGEVRQGAIAMDPEFANRVTLRSLYVEEFDLVSRTMPEPARTQQLVQLANRIAALDERDRVGPAPIAERVCDKGAKDRRSRRSRRMR